MWGSVSLRSILLTVFFPIPAASANSCWVSARSTRNSLSLSPT
jgi:hypothetical protein